VTVPFISAFSCAHDDIAHRRLSSNTLSAYFAIFIRPPEKTRLAGEAFVLETGCKGAEQAHLRHLRKTSFAHAKMHRARRRSEPQGDASPRHVFLPGVSGKLHG
jgi:hypothetical protein